MMNKPDPETLRYSMLPAPPPLTDLEFYAALVADYNRAASKLPHLLSKKIRGGIPPPLRGVVWIAMSGARDSSLEGLYDQLLGETSPYEHLIGKDIGRTGLEMFKQEGGEGQRMLGRVLRAFSIYDTQIGYCQGFVQPSPRAPAVSNYCSLGFLVGPLLMHMGEKEAFCVLVRFVNLRQGIVLEERLVTCVIGLWSIMIFVHASCRICTGCSCECTSSHNSLHSIYRSSPHILIVLGSNQHMRHNGFYHSLPSVARCLCSSEFTTSFLPRVPRRLLCV